MTKNYFLYWILASHFSLFIFHRVSLFFFSLLFFLFSFFLFIRRRVTVLLICYRTCNREFFIRNFSHRLRFTSIISVLGYHFFLVIAFSSPRPSPPPPPQSKNVQNAVWKIIFRYFRQRRILGIRAEAG